jgi:glycosyltransferase involved in cell wall biosynthesis
MSDNLLTFVIPTRKRQRELSACVQSIAEQVGELDVAIIIIYNSSDAPTIRAVSRLEAKWSFVSSISMDGDPPYGDKFRMMFRAARDSEWVWTFGDDDTLRPGALDFMVERLKKADDDLSFIHVAELSRASGTGNTYTGRLIDLCCSIGWLEITGFITGNITRGSLLAQCADTEHWDEYAKCAYVQSCALLEGLKDHKAQFIDLPLIETGSPPPVENDTPELKKRRNHIWIWSYLLMDDAVKIMFDHKIITGKVPIKFFRYHHYYLWDRQITYYISYWLGNGEIWDDVWAGHVKQLADFIDDDKMATRIRQSVDSEMKMVYAHVKIKEMDQRVKDDLKALFELHSEHPYPFAYTDGPGEHLATVYKMERKAA